MERAGGSVSLGNYVERKVINQGARVSTL